METTSKAKMKDMRNQKVQEEQAAILKFWGKKGKHTAATVSEKERQVMWYISG